MRREQGSGLPYVENHKLIQTVQIRLQAGYFPYAPQRVSNNVYASQWIHIMAYHPTRGDGKQYQNART